MGDFDRGSHAEGLMLEESARIFSAAFEGRDHQDEHALDVTVGHIGRSAKAAVHRVVSDDGHRYRNDGASFVRHIGKFRPEFAYSAVGTYGNTRRRIGRQIIIRHPENFPFSIIRV
ncbi:hypothetical protein [Streptomyces sp. NPDC054887]